jgi:hypothetical protein
LPVLGADVFVAVGVAQRKLNAVVFQPHALEHELHQIESGPELFLDLIGGAEEVGVVLGQSANAEHAVEFARLLVPVDRSEFRQPHRQIAIAPRQGLVNLHVMGTVHRSETFSCECSHFLELILSDGQRKLQPSTAQHARRR